MATQSPPNRAALRAFVVVALSLLMIGIFATDLRRLWQPVGVFGYSTNGDGTVLFVQDDSPAAKAGMQSGDRVDESSTPPQFRPLVVQGTFVWAPGQKVTFGLVHDRIHRAVTLTSLPPPNDSVLLKTFRVAEFGAAVLFVLIGAALVLLRPGLTTWGFFFYCLAFAPGSWISIWALPFPGNWIAAIIFDLIQVAGLVGLVIFAFCFLSESFEGWRSAVLRSTPWLLIALLMVWLFTLYQTYWVGGQPGEMLFRIILALIAATSLLALYAFLDTYVRSTGTDKQRLRWIIVGFAASLTAFFAYWTLEFYSNTTPYWVLHPLFLTGVLVPLTIGYAVIKHRVIDVSFVVSRALVFGVVTTLLVGAFSIVDWLFTEKLRLARLGTIMEMGVAVAGGIWFNSLHKRVDSLIDATFFRQRHKAEQLLARNSAALPFSTATETVAHALIAEPMRALSLASAALFRRRQDGSYVREAAEGWSGAEISTLDREDDHLLSLMQAQHGPISLYDHPWRTQGVPSGPAHPVLALPIILRNEVAAVVFYGAHVYGEPLDPDEIKAVASLAPGAAAAYDHLEAESMRRTVGSLMTKVELLQAQLEEAQIQPA